MPQYTYECELSHVTTRLYSIHSYNEKIKCPVCKEQATRIYISVPEANVFKPYIANNVASKPVEIRNRAHRDAVCKKIGATYDKSSNLKPVYRQPNSDTLGEIGYKKWAEDMKKHGRI